MLRLGIIIAITFLAIFSAQAQQRVLCMQKERMMQVRTIVYGERMIARGLTASSMVFELLINHETRTWSVLLTTLNNVSCLVGSGTEIEFIGVGLCYRLSKDEKSNLGYKSASLDQTSYRQICAQGSSHTATARARSGEPPFPR